MNVSWCVLAIIEPDRKHICYYPGKNDWEAFTMTIKRLLKWWDVFQSTQRSVDITWFSFVPLSHIQYKLSGQPWFSRSQGSFLTKLTSSEAKMSLMVQQLFIPSPAALGIKMELVKSFLIGSSQVGTPLQRRWRRVNFQGMCPQMKKETWSLKTEAMLALPWLPDFSKLHKVKQCQLEVNQIPA